MTQLQTPAPAAVVAPRKPPGAKKRRRRGDGRAAMIFISPALLGFLIFYVTPLVRGIYNSLTSYNLLRSPKWTGTSNYVALWHDEKFWNALRVTFTYVIINVSTQTILALGIAVLMDRLTRSVAIRCAIVFPWLVPNVAIATISLFMLDRNVGVINHVLEKFGFARHAFYRAGNEAIPTIALVNTWRNMGYTALLLFAGMQMIPRSVYEAAAIDGASEWRVFRQITLPLLRPVLALVLVVSVVGSLQIFDTVSIVYKGSVLTQADVIYNYIYRTAFAQFRMGYASAIAVALFVIIGVVTALQLRLLRANTSDLG